MSLDFEDPPAQSYLGDAKALSAEAPPFESGVGKIENNHNGENPNASDDTAGRNTLAPYILAGRGEADL